MHARQFSGWLLAALLSRRSIERAAKETHEGLPFNMTNPKSRIVSGIAANFYSQIVTVIAQLVSLPIFLTWWSAEQYGRWLMISAIPAYLGISDVGILTAAGNLMSMHQARHETAEVNRIFSSSVVAMLVVLPTLALCAAALLFSFSFGLSLDQRGALCALILTTLLSVACSLFDAAYRPFGKYPRATFLLTSARVLDYIGMFAGLIIGGSLTSTALGFLTARAIDCVAMFFLAKNDIPEIRWNLRDVDGRLIRRLMRSGIGFLSFPFGYLLTLQGMLIVVGAQLGGSAVALFSSSRTLTRLLAQISDTAGRSMAPEISALYGAGREPEAIALSNQVLRNAILLVLFGALALAFLGPTILQHWSRGKLRFDGTVFTFLLLAAIASTYWQIQGVRLTATNRHSLLATIFALSSAFALLMAYLTEPLFGLSATAAAACFVDIAMIVGTTIALRRVAAAGYRHT
jgi:O-antigen/teichoic acid export membrane protein